MKIKKLLILASILVLLIIYLFVSKNNASNSDQPYSDFAFPDTAQIDMVVISNTLDQSRTIQRRNNTKEWLLDDTDVKASKESIERILSTIHQWKVLQDVEESYVEIVNRQLSTKHHKVEIYTNGSNEAIKTYYVGDANKNMNGNFALLKNGKKKSSVPYIVNKPGFYGTLETRFYTDFTNWRSTEIISLDAQNIKTIQLTNRDFINESYKIDVDKDIFKLYDVNNSPINTFDTLAVRRHLIVFRTLHLESFANDVALKTKDSILSESPMFTLIVEDVKNNSTKVDLYCKPNLTNKTAPNGEILSCNPMSMYGLINGKEFVSIQINPVSWGSVFKPLSYFKTQ